MNLRLYLGQVTARRHSTEGSPVVLWRDTKCSSKSGPPMTQPTTAAAQPSPARVQARPQADAGTNAATGQMPARVYAPVPRGGGRLIVEEDGDRTVYTTTELPPQMLMMAHRAQQTAFGLMGMLAVIVIVGPFARMFARRIEKRAERDMMGAAGTNAQLLQQQLLQLQQSVDAMSVEVERISESQRFQSKLLYEKASRP
ncbi:MAG: hypothetical protein JWM95_4820 [Gemmatimonadetes bacterium]|nr:hypothetical protein [Gemmatimonadota bacterium]